MSTLHSLIPGRLIRRRRLLLCAHGCCWESDNAADKPVPRLFKALAACTFILRLGADLQGNGKLKESLSKGCGWGGGAAMLRQLFLHRICWAKCHNCDLLILQTCSLIDTGYSSSTSSRVFVFNSSLPPRNSGVRKNALSPVDSHNNIVR